MISDLYAVVGNPIEHSLSPLIHSTFALETGQEISYEKLYAPLDQFDSTVDQFFINGGLGLNVTAPFKNEAFKWVDELSATSTQSNAVNTIAQMDGKFVGYNTDGAGLINDLTRLGWQLAEKQVLILGAGGATQGILAPLLASGADITVANRTLAKADALRSQFPKIKILALKSIRPGWDVVIHATSSHSFETDVAVAKSVFQDSACYDLSYSQSGSTSFTEFVRTTARLVTDGLGMLVEQAALSFNIWRGVKPTTRAVLERLRSPKRQFIAGASCEKCAHVDSTYVEQDLLGNSTVKGCIDCGHIERIDGTKTVSIR